MTRLFRHIILYCQLVRFDKPTGIFLLLWPTLWGLWLASDGLPGWKIFFTFLFGTVLMRSAGCAINDWADFKFDSQVARTCLRPLPTGRIAPREALWVAVILAALSFLLALTLNTLSIKLSIVAALLAGTYPWTKRFLAIPQAYLGIAFGFGIPMAYAAVTNMVPAIAWALVLANCFWTLAYDTEYAMVDRADDLKLGIHTSAITLGRFDVVAILACYFVFFALMVMVGVIAARGSIYFIGLLAATLWLPGQYGLIRQRKPADCLKAFHLNNGIGAFVFLGIALDCIL